MNYLHPTRLANLLGNAETAAKQGSKPYPYVLIFEDDGIRVAGIGQHLMVEDYEPGNPGSGAVAITHDEAKEAAKAIRGAPNAGKKDTEVSVSLDGDIFRVAAGDEVFVEIADLGDEADDAWELRLKAQELYESPRERADRLTMYDVTILTKLGQLKPGDGSKTVTLWPSFAADTTVWELGSVRGFIEGNRGTTAPEVSESEPSGILPGL